ncbi:unnamed protein product [Staurois parvus]|uniref:Uncharacterized protein n=1 Tax=Staurois parvus TaxID=386267 RepID=A0ABN9BPB4_9NEOB|nr:unnamed protein product [Staurois parvus]
MFEKQLNDLNHNYENLQQNKAPYYDDVAPQLKVARAQALYQRKELSPCMSLPLDSADMNDMYAVVQKRPPAPSVSSGSKSLPTAFQNQALNSSHHQYDNVRPRTMFSKPTDQLYSTVAIKPNRTSTVPAFSPTTTLPVSSSYALAGAPGSPETTSNDYSQFNVSSAVLKKTPSFHNSKGDNRWSQNSPSSYTMFSRPPR